MYIFYVDEKGNLDTHGIHPGMDYSASPKDWLYVLTALGIFEHNWRKFYDPIAAKKKILLQVHNAGQVSLDECEIKSKLLQMISAGRPTFLWPENMHFFWKVEPVPTAGSGISWKCLSLSK